MKLTKIDLYELGKVGLATHFLTNYNIPKWNKILIGLHYKIQGVSQSVVTFTLIYY